MDSTNEIELLNWIPLATFRDHLKWLKWKEDEQVKEEEDNLWHCVAPKYLSMQICIELKIWLFFVFSNLER